MISPEQIREMLRAQPFKPFRICLSDGTTFDIVHHDMAFVGANTVEVGINLNAKGFAEYFSRCAIMHITKIDDLQPA